MTHDNIDILVVDDDISHCTILQALLRGWGYNVALANSGRQNVAGPAIELPGAPRYGRRKWCAGPQGVAAGVFRCSDYRLLNAADERLSAGQCVAAVLAVKQALDTQRVGIFKRVRQKAVRRHPMPVARRWARWPSTASCARCATRTIGTAFCRTRLKMPTRWVSSACLTDRKSVV